MARTTLSTRDAPIELMAMEHRLNAPAPPEHSDGQKEAPLYIDETASNSHLSPPQRPYSTRTSAAQVPTGVASRSNSSSRQTSPRGSTPNTPRPFAVDGGHANANLESSAEGDPNSLRAAVQLALQRFEKIAGESISLSLNEISCSQPVPEPKAWSALTSQLDQRDQAQIAGRFYEILYGLRAAAGGDSSSATLAGRLMSGLDLFTPKTLNTNAYKGRRVPSVQLVPSGPEMPMRSRAAPESTTLLEERSMTSSLASIPRASVLENGVCDKGEDEVGFTTINQKYTIVELIGKGNFGKVFKALDSNGTEVAIKEMDCNIKAPKHRLGAAMQPKLNRSASGSSFGAKAMRRRSRCHSVVPDSLVMREVAIMKKLSHKNIVQLYEVIHDDEEDKVLLVMQYLDHGSLGEVDSDGQCDVLEEEKLKSCIRQAATGLNYLHRHNIVHRDVKPENLLVSSAGGCFLADFGVSAVVREGNVVDFSAGTPTFFSPEMFRGHPEQVAKYGRQSDIWALGVTLFALRFGEVPYFRSNILDLARSVREDPIPFPSDLPADDPIRDLLEGMLCKDPEKRMTLSTIRRHRFFGSVEVDSDPSLPDSINLPVEGGTEPIPEFEVTQEDVQLAIASSRRVTVCLPRRLSRNEQRPLRQASHDDLIKFIATEPRRASEQPPAVEATMGPTEAGSPVRLAKHRKQQQQQQHGLSKSVRMVDVDGPDPTQLQTSGEGDAAQS